MDGTAVERTGGRLDWETPQIAPKAERLSEKVPMRTDALPGLFLSGFYPHLDSRMLAGRVILCSKETRRALPAEIDQLRRKDLKSLSSHVHTLSMNFSPGPTLCSVRQPRIITHLRKDGDKKRPNR